MVSAALDADRPARRRLNGRWQSHPRGSRPHGVQWEWRRSAAQQRQRNLRPHRDQVVRSWRMHMRTTIATGVALSFIAASLLAQTVPNTVDAHIAAAKAAAGTEHVAVFNSLCMATEERASSNPAPARAATPAPPPERAKWHTGPVKVFDNLYYLGQSEYSAWAVN